MSSTRTWIVGVDASPVSVRCVRWFVKHIGREGDRARLVHVIPGCVRACVRACVRVRIRVFVFVLVLVYARDSVIDDDDDDDDDDDADGG